MSLMGDSSLNSPLLAWGLGGEKKTPYKDLSEKPPLDKILNLSHIGWRLMVTDGQRTSLAAS